VNVTQKVVVAGGTGGGGGGGGGAGGGGGFHNTYAPPAPYMPPQPLWFSGPGYPLERAERAVYNEHGVYGASKMPTVNQAHSEMSVADLIDHRQQPPVSFHDSAPMEMDEPTVGGSRAPSSVPATQVVGGMSTGPGASASGSASVSMTSVKNTSKAGPPMSTGTYSTAPSSFSFSTANRGAGQAQSVPSTEVVVHSGGSIGVSIPLPDTEMIVDEVSSRPRVKRSPPSRSESSVGNNYLAIHDSQHSGRVEPNAIVPRASGQSAYGTPPNRTLRMPGGAPGKFAKAQDRLMQAEADRMRRVLDEDARRLNERVRNAMQNPLPARRPMQIMENQMTMSGSTRIV